MSNEHRIVANALKDATFVTSMTRRQGGNGLRNADEIATQIVAALAAEGYLLTPKELFDNPE